MHDMCRAAGGVVVFSALSPLGHTAELAYCPGCPLLLPERPWFLARDLATLGGIRFKTSDTIADGLVLHIHELQFYGNRFLQVNCLAATLPSGW